VLVNTAIAKADNPPLMAEAFKHAVESGRAAYFAGRIQRSEIGNPSSPTKFLS
jgi:thiazole synthase